MNVIRKVGEKIKSNELQIDEIDETLVESLLYTANTPDPELLIRTSGEIRLSNFCYGSVRIRNFGLLMYIGRISKGSTCLRPYRIIKIVKEDLVGYRGD